MCRFLLVRSKKAIKPQELLGKFSSMSRASKAPNGDWQGDGWGVAWLNDENKWQTHHSVKPVWEEEAYFSQIPPSRIFLAHARSATFPDQKGILAYNQPYISGQYAFVFNGFLQGVNISETPGKIGAQKIWHLLRQTLNSNEPQISLEIIKDLLIRNSREVVGLNIGLATPQDIFSLSCFTKYADYYSLSRLNNKDLQIICSEKLDW